MTNASSSRVAWTCRGRRTTESLQTASQASALVPFSVSAFTHINVQAQRGHGGGLAQRQHHEQEAGQQLHHVEQVVVGKQVRRQCFGVSRVSEKLVVVLTLLNTSFKTENQYVL